MVLGALRLRARARARAPLLRERGGRLRRGGETPRAAVTRRAHGSPARCSRGRASRSRRARVFSRSSENPEARSRPRQCSRRRLPGTRTTPRGARPRRGGRRGPSRGAFFSPRSRSRSRSAAARRRRALSWCLPQILRRLRRRILARRARRNRRTRRSGRRASGHASWCASRNPSPCATDGRASGALRGRGRWREGTTLGKRHFAKQNSAKKHRSVSAEAENPRLSRSTPLRKNFRLERFRDPR